LTDRALAAELEQGLASLVARWRKAVGGAALDELHAHMAAMADSPALAACPLAVHLVHQTQVFGQRTAAYISEHGYPGMTFAQILVIGSVPADGAVETATMVRQRLISRQAMHVHLDHLVAAGLLTKSVSTQDARRTYVAFTAKGRRMLDTAIDAIDHEERRRERKIGKTALGRVKDLLQRLES
jgi:DNA-binding MarR family transcriptional regulator